MRFNPAIIRDAVLISAVMACWSAFVQAEQANLLEARSWQAMPDWLGNPAVRFEAAEGTGMRFRVLQPGRGMKWRRSVDPAIFTAATRSLTLRYRAEDVALSSEYFLYLAGRTPEKPFVEVFPIALQALENDGAWHLLTADLPALEVTTLAIQVQALSPQACVEIAEMTWSPSRPIRRLGDCLNVQGHWPASDIYKPIPIQANTPAAGWLAGVGFEPSWFSAEKIAVDGVPFRVQLTDPQLLSTPLDQTGEVSIDLNREADVVYLLLGAEFKGPESPSLGTGPLTRVRQVDRFVARLEYADGMAELIFPARHPSGAHSIGQELAVYALRPTRHAAIRRLRLLDGMRQGRFLLAGVTVGTDQPPGTQPGAVEATPFVVPSQPATEPFNGRAVESGFITLWVDRDSQQAVRLTNRLTQTEWLARPSPLYAIESDEPVSATLDARALPTGELELTLELVNPHAKSVRAKPTFPLVQALSPGGDPSELAYCFPRRGAAISTAPTHLREPYSGLFPLQFVDVSHPAAGGLYVMTRDTTNTPKTFWLNKEDQVELGVEYWPRVLGPNERWRLPTAVIGTHRGDWHAALAAYRRWLGTWYRPTVPRKQWFREVFNFRQQFLHFELPRRSGAFDASTKKLHLPEVLDADRAAFGGVDYLHLFDWGWTPTKGRCGDYDPWDHLGGLNPFADQVAQIQSAGIPVGLYIEGYLIDPQSDVGKLHGQEWQLLAGNGQPYTNFAPSLHICSHVPAWQDYLAATYARVARQTRARGFYIDEFGFAAHYVCHNPQHGHEVPASPLRGEEQLTRKVRAALPPDAVIYTEETPTDVTSQLHDGSFTYAISSAIDHLSPTHLNLTRFALPDFKTIEIIVCDKPLADDQEAVRRVFFNGEAIWLEGIADDWFTPELRALIAKTHRILREHRGAFCSLDVEPLVSTCHPDVYANRFTLQREVVWTLYNTAWSTVRGELLTIEHVPGTEYFDAWNGRTIPAAIIGSEARLTLELGPRDVGCVVQRQPGDEP